MEFAHIHCIDFTHILLPCLKKKTNQWDYPISPQALVLFYWAKARGLSGKQMAASLIKLQMTELPLYTLQLFFPLLYLSSPFLCNQQQHQGLVTHCGLQRSLQAYCLSSKVEHAAGMPDRLARAPAFTQFTSGMAMTLLWFRWRGSWSEIKHFNLHRTFYYGSWKHIKNLNCHVTSKLIISFHNKRHHFALYPWIQNLLTKLACKDWCSIVPFPFLCVYVYTTIILLSCNLTIKFFLIHLLNGNGTL